MDTRVTVAELIDGPYYDYAYYTLTERAIPSFVDGLKPVHRKILWTAQRDAKTWRKTAALAGSVISRGIYFHGDGSLSAAIGLMAADWANNIPLLEGKGSFGTRLTEAAGISAPRYTSVKISPAFEKFFRDEELLEYGEDEEDAEPKYFLPVIPWILVNGISGIAVGYACEWLRYDVGEIVENMRRFADGKPLKKMTPSYRGFTGRIERTDDGVWCYGVFERVRSTLIRVKDVPVGVTREAYVKHLMNLEERGKIKDFVDRCRKTFEFDVSIYRNSFKRDEEVFKTLGLAKRLSENMVAVDENGKLVKFSTPEEVVERFTAFRLEKVYPARKRYLLQKIESELDWARCLERFVAAVREKKIDLGNLKSRDELRKAAVKIAGATPEQADRLSAIPAYRFTRDQQRAIAEKINSLEKELKRTESREPRDFLLEDLDSVPI